MQTRRALLPLWCLITLSALLPPSHAQWFGKKSALSREKGALYLEDVTEQEISLKTLSEAPVYSNLRGERRLGVIPQGRSVTLVAVGERALRVRGRALHDNVVGWISRAAVTPLSDDFVKQLRAATERREKVDALIDKKQIAVGMTTEEVEASIGEPTERTSRVNAEGRQETYDYITYRTVSEQILQYDQYGRGYYVLVPRKIETGRRTVDFNNGVVSSYSETERRRAAGNGRLVPPPVILRGGW